LGEPAHLCLESPLEIREFLNYAAGSWIERLYKLQALARFDLMRKKKGIRNEPIRQISESLPA
jgi:hypothetical protein